MSNFTRVPALIAAAIIVAIWLVMTVGGLIYAFTGEVHVLEILLSLTPITLLAAGTVYFTLAVSRALIRVGDQGIVYRTALRFYWMPYRDIASATLVRRWAEIWGMPIDAGFRLRLTPADPAEKPVYVGRLFGRDDEQFIQAVEQWQRYHAGYGIDVATRPREVPDGALTLAIDNYGAGSEPGAAAPIGQK